jgi:uncharacterized membrane protein YgcG
MRIVAALAAALLTAAPAAAEIQFPKLTGRVVDASQAIPDDQEAELTRELADFERRTKHQMVVVTVPDIGDVPQDQYAVELGRHWGIGRKGIDDGIVLLQSSGDGRPGSGRLYVAVGYGLEDTMTDKESNEIAREVALPILKQDRPRSETTPEAIVAVARATMEFASVSRQERSLAEQREITKRETDHRRRMATFWDGLLTLLGLGATGGAGYGIWRLATRKERARRKAALLAQAKLEREAAEKRAAEAAAARAEERRLARIEADRLAAEERERQAEALRRREAMLAAMSPTDRAAFLAEERRQEEERQRAREAQERRDREEADRRRRQREQDEQEERERQQRRDEENARNAAIIAAAAPPPPPPPSDFGSSDNFTPGGGSFGGGGGGIEY